MDKFATVPLIGVGGLTSGDWKCQKLPQEMLADSEGQYSRWLQTTWPSETSYFTKPRLGSEPQEPDIFLDHLVCQWQQQQQKAIVGKHLTQTKSMD